MQLANRYGAGIEREQIGNTSQCVLFLSLEQEFLAYSQIMLCL